MSRSTRKPTLWTLRNMVTQISLRHIPSHGDGGRVMIPETENPQEVKSVCPA